MRRRVPALLLAMGVLLLAPGAALSEQPALSEAEALAGAALYEPDTGTTLWQKNAQESRAVAGLCKLPAILTLCQMADDSALDPSATLRVSAAAADVGRPTAFLEEGETIALSELLKAAIMISAGDAITALGEHAFGSREVFAENVNVTLRQCGVSSQASDPLGAGLTLSAGDLAKIGAAALESTTFTKYCMLYLDALLHADGRETELVNANRLVLNYAGCTGLLTGSSPEDGYCGVFSATRNGTRLIAAVIGAETAVRRTGAAVALLDYGFAAFRTVTLAEAGKAVIDDVPVRDGDVKTTTLVTRETLRVLLPVGEQSPEPERDMPDKLEAPVSAAEPAGKLIWRAADGTVLAEAALYAETDVAAFGLKDIVMRIAACFVA